MVKATRGCFILISLFKSKAYKQVATWFCSLIKALRCVGKSQDFGPYYQSCTVLNSKVAGNNKKILVQIFHLSGKAFRLFLTCPSRPIALVFLAMSFEMDIMPANPAAHAVGGSGPYGGFWKLLFCPSRIVSPQRQMFYLLDLGLSHRSWVSAYVHFYGQAWDSDTSRWCFSGSLLLGVREIVHRWKRNCALF